jgi:hypothetical protein
MAQRGPLRASRGRGAAIGDSRRGKENEDGTRVNGVGEVRGVIIA